MASITKILDRLSDLELAAKQIIHEDEEAWKTAEIKKLEMLRREYFDGWNLIGGVWINGCGDEFQNGL